MKDPPDEELPEDGEAEGATLAETMALDGDAPAEFEVGAELVGFAWVVGLFEEGAGTPDIEVLVDTWDCG